MPSFQKIHAFALKYLDLFSSSDTAEQEVVDGFSELCFSFDFKMDGGDAFEAAYPRASFDPDQLKQIIHQVYDIPLLGSAIFSRWRYYTHWSQSSILEADARAWFVTAFRRLAILAVGLFEGTLQKFSLFSDDHGFRLLPDSDEEIRQRLTIRDDGRVWLTHYYGCDDQETSHTEQFLLDQEKLMIIFAAVADNFGKPYEVWNVTDVGSWHLQLINTEGQPFEYSGSLCSDFECNGIDLSDLIRYVLNNKTLYVFDGNAQKDWVEQIEINYLRQPKIKQPVRISETAQPLVYRERLIIDRETETIEYYQRQGADFEISRKIHIAISVSNLLDCLNVADLFTNCGEDPEDVFENPDDCGNYEIRVSFNNQPQRLLKGSFDKNGLPKDWPDFAEEMQEFLSLYELGDLFDPAVYERAKRRKSDRIYCSVVFDEWGKSYYYLTEDEKLQVGDWVQVPAGKDNQLSRAQIVKIEYFTDAEAPFNPDKMKWIIRKIQ